MTKRREPLTYHQTLTEVAAAIGWDRCAALCGVTTRAVRNWSDHDCETEIRMIDAERLDRAFMEHGGEYAPFHRLFGLRLDIAARTVEGGFNLAMLAGASAKEVGEAVAALIAASGNPTCARARRRATKETQDAISVLTDGLAALDRAGGAS